MLFDRITIDIHLSEGADAGPHIGKWDDSLLDTAISALRDQIEEILPQLEAYRRIKSLDAGAAIALKEL